MSGNNPNLFWLELLGHHFDIICRGETNAILWGRSEFASGFFMSSSLLSFLWCFATEIKNGTWYGTGDGLDCEIHLVPTLAQYGTAILFVLMIRLKKFLQDWKKLAYLTEHNGV